MASGRHSRTEARKRCLVPDSQLDREEGQVAGMMRKVEGRMREAWVGRKEGFTLLVHRVSVVSVIPSAFLCCVVT